MIFKSVVGGLKTNTCPCLMLIEWDRFLMHLVLCNMLGSSNYGENPIKMYTQLVRISFRDSSSRYHNWHPINMILISLNPLMYY